MIAEPASNTQLLDDNTGSVSILSISSLQSILLLCLLAFGILLIVITIEDHLINTLLLFIGVTVIGFILSNKTAGFLNDKNLRLLGTFWLIKIFITFILLYAGWIPELDPNTSARWGYDPQRYYQYAWDLVLQNWNPFGIDLNYQGILYYYGVIFSFIGRNPVTPALINSFVTLQGILLLIRSLYRFMPECHVNDWRIAYLIFVPEVLWYDVMTGRETLMAVLIIFSTLPVGRLVLGDKVSGKTIKILVTIGSLFAIMAVRTSMLLPVVCCLLFFTFSIKSKNSSSRFLRIFIISIVLFGLFVAPFVQEISGGYSVDFLNNLEQIQAIEGNVAETAEWDNQSIGMLIMPSGLLSSFFFLPPRMLLYLVTPLPKITVSVMELISGSWYSWQSLMTVLTSILMLIFFPYVLGGSYLAWQCRKKYPAIGIVPITFWINFIAVAGGNLIIHERYRLMFTLLFFATSWIGYTRTSYETVKKIAFYWLIILFSCAIFYIVYKSL